MKVPDHARIIATEDAGDRVRLLWRVADELRAQCFHCGSTTPQAYVYFFYEPGADSSTWIGACCSVLCGIRRWHRLR